MYKQLTYLCKNYKINTPLYLKVLNRFVMPLFQICIYDMRSHMDLQKKAKLFRSGFFNKSLQNKNFTKLLVIHSNIDGNCRRDKLINIKRDSIIEFMNENVDQGLFFWITLSKANHYTPDHQLINQLKLSLQKFKEKVTYENPKKNVRTPYIDPSKLNVLQVLNNLNLQKWSSYISHNFPSKLPTNMTILQLQNSYFQVTISNFYKIKYSKNQKALYEDMKDFDKLLSKFNFLRYFMTSGISNAVRNHKNCQGLIKKLKWRTAETQSYLLLLLRNNSWERVCITVQNFVYIYDTQFKSQPKLVQQKI